MHSYQINLDKTVARNFVLILVLMEDALVLNATTSEEVKAQVVLILVLMEDALVQEARFIYVNSQLS